MKLLIVDDHPIVLNALAAELGAAHQCVLATSLQESLNLVTQHADLDMIIFDPGLPDSRGVEGLMRLRAAAPSIPLLVLSGSIDAAEIKQALEFGAAGFVPKTTETAILKQAIEMVMAGGVYVPAEYVGANGKARQTPAKLNDSALGLTRREKEILPLLALGRSNKTIAYELGLSENTVRVHVAHILKKMKATNRTQAVAKLLFGSGQ